MIKYALIVAAVFALVGGVAVLWLRRSDVASADPSEFPITYNVANFMDPAELKEVEKTVRQRGEHYLISIAVVSSNTAQVHVGDGRFLRPPSGRVYHVARADGAWQIKDVESWKH